MSIVKTPSNCGISQRGAILERCRDLTSTSTPLSWATLLTGWARSLATVPNAGTKIGPITPLITYNTSALSSDKPAATSERELHVRRLGEASAEGRRGSGGLRRV